MARHRGSSDGIHATSHRDAEVPIAALLSAVAVALAELGICIQHGNYYAQNLSERLGLEEGGGVIRAAMTHYNTSREIERLLNALN